MTTSSKSTIRKINGLSIFGIIFLNRKMNWLSIYRMWLLLHCFRWLENVFTVNFWHVIPTSLLHFIGRIHWLCITGMWLLHHFVLLERSTDCTFLPCNNLFITKFHWEDPLTVDPCAWMNDCVFIYHTYHFMSHGGLQVYWERLDVSLWKHLWLLLSVHIWSHSPTQPVHEMWDDTRDRPQHRELRALLFLIGVWVF